MQTKKSTTSKLNWADILSDIFVAIMTILLAAASLYVFYKDLTQVMERNDKMPVATVTFKYKSVQRKFIDRALWDRPLQNSPVYNGDTIRTAPESEATIWFSDKNTVELAANTMIQVFVKNDETSVNLSGGKLSVKAENAGMKLLSGGAEIQVAEGAVLRADAEQKEGLKVSVEKGQVELVAADGSSQVLEQGSVSQAGQTPVLQVLLPPDGAKILYQGGEGAPVNFSWKSTFDQAEEMVLETASNRSFSANTETFVVTGLQEFKVLKKTGTLYWRLYPKKDGYQSKAAVAGFVRVLDAPPPKPVMPAQQTVYSYRLKTPSIRFLWEGNNYAASYNLEVADNPQMTNPVYSAYSNVSSVTLSDFAEGTWYWQLTPRYLIGDAVVPAVSPVFSFIINKKGSLDPPQLIYPKALTDISRGKGLTFSWQNNSEAASYILRVANNAAMKNPVIEKPLKSNHFSLEKAASVLPNGTWFWTVLVVDSEGAKSSESTPLSFLAMDSELVLRTLFPPDNYILSDSLCYDTRFTWKTNVSLGLRFQVSASKEFDTLAVDIPTSNTTMQNLILPPGEWYWRVVLSNEDVFVATPLKKLVVAKPLDKPVAKAEKRILTRLSLPTTLAWQAVEGADYYQVKILQTDRSLPPLYENLSLTKPELTLPMQTYEEKNYILFVQPFAYETTASSRRYGLALEHEFALRHLRPIKLVTPDNNTVFAGLDAKLHPSSLSWSTVDPPAESLLVLTKVDSGQVVLSIKDPSTKVALPPLDAGRYRWTVDAKTSDDLDISALTPSSFEVLPIPRLAAPAIIEPEQKIVFGVPFFKNNRKIVFRWKAVPTATAYVFEIKTSAGNTVFAQSINKPGNDAEISLVFDKLGLLARDTFSWTVTAERRIKNNELLQGGIPATATFIVDLPEAKTKINEAGILYGK